MDERKVFIPDTKLELSHCFDKGGRFDVAHRATELYRLRPRPVRKNHAYLDDTDVWFFARIIDGDLGHAFYPVLDSTGDVRHDLWYRS